MDCTNSLILQIEGIQFQMNVLHIFTASHRYQMTYVYRYLLKYHKDDDYNIIMTEEIS